MGFGQQLRRRRHGALVQRKPLVLAAGGARLVMSSGLLTRRPAIFPVPNSTEQLEPTPGRSAEDSEFRVLRDLSHVGAGSIEEFEFLMAPTDFFTDSTEYIKCSSL